MELPFRIQNKIPFLAPLALAISLFFLYPQPGVARPGGAAQATAAKAAPPKLEIEEWVYRLKYGHEEEWFQIFKKYQVAILERQKQLGYVKEFTIYAPSLHVTEEARWDYRVVIVRAAGGAPSGQSEGEVAKQLFPDRASFKREENRRWELTANHWDLPIHIVTNDGAE